MARTAPKNPFLMGEDASRIASMSETALWNAVSGNESKIRTAIEMLKVDDPKNPATRLVAYLQQLYRGPVLAVNADGTINVEASASYISELADQGPLTAGALYPGENGTVFELKTLLDLSSKEFDQDPLDHSNTLRRGVGKFGVNWTGVDLAVKQLIYYAVLTREVDTNSSMVVTMINMWRTMQFLQIAAMMPLAKKQFDGAKAANRLPTLKISPKADASAQATSQVTGAPELMNLRDAISLMARYRLEIRQFLAQTFQVDGTLELFANDLRDFVNRWDHYKDGIRFSDLPNRRDGVPNVVLSFVTTIEQKGHQPYLLALLKERYPQFYRETFGEQAGNTYINSAIAQGPGASATVINTFGGPTIRTPSISHGSGRPDVHQVVDILSGGLFNLDDLERLTLTLDLDWDNIAGNTKSAKARNLVITCGKNNLFDSLVEEIRKLRPNAGL